MNPSNSVVDYSIFGGKKIEDDEEEKLQQSQRIVPQETQPEKQETQVVEEPIEEPQQESVEEPNAIDYSKFGGTPAKEEKKKAGKGSSTLYGLAEGLLGVPSLIQYGMNEWSNSLDKAIYGEEAPKGSFAEENPIMAFLQTFPESEDESSRRLRVGASGVGTGAVFGIPGIIAGLVGSQAGQTIREVYGEDGKFKDFGWGEGAAIAADIAAGGVAGVLTSAAKGGARVAANEAPAIFRKPESRLDKALVKHVIRSEKDALQNVIDSFSDVQIKGFESVAERLSTDRFTQLSNSGASTLKQNADNMFRRTHLSAISPIEATAEQGGRAIQEAANTTFQSQVIKAEQAAYGRAREAAEKLSGKAPKSLKEAKELRAEFTKNTPTPEQQPLVTFLDNFIADLETTTPASTTPASKILDKSGKPIIEAIEHEATSTPTTRKANDLVDKVQRANQSVNYEAELRYQSHRLAPLLKTFRGEVGEILAKNPIAARAYQEANALHGSNAEIWGTKFMRNLRFAENPESNVGKLRHASNMRNFKQGVKDPAMQALGERLVIDQLTEGGSATSNRNAINKLAPELSNNARQSSQELMNVKDPLTTSGGRAAVRNDILKDAAQSVNTGKRPEKILDLMQTPKGYEIVRESMNGTPESKRLFNSFQRLFVEDVFSSVTDKTGKIDFKKAQSVFKNKDVRNVVQLIGGDEVIERFNKLESFANNLEKNISLYKSPEAKSLFQNIAKETKSAGILGAVLHALHIPTPVIASLGIGGAGVGVTKLTYNALKSQVLDNPRALQILESISKATTIDKLAEQVPRFVAEIEKKRVSD